MTQILAGAGLFLLGLLLGLVFQRAKGNSAKEQRVEQKLAETEENFAKYQAEVSAHFVDTARKVQQLNTSYRDVHEQLAKGAGMLCGDNEAQDFLAISQQPNTSKEEPIDTQGETLPEEAPMDYAPKEDPNAAGTLSEEYSLKEDGDTQPTGSAQETPENEAQSKVS